ncbi:hypothetical protein Slin15195_G121850 [Septoria linicola]|uniref:Uncharacterized protein n=1 Tax=Septoria linicola TaxID=215465 RepID=A0A9Q9B885_9PEZI|nr:hypothetical protein Slin15195_G121850 [Septoria linicola]
MKIRKCKQTPVCLDGKDRLEELPSPAMNPANAGRPLSQQLHQTIDVDDMPLSTLPSHSRQPYVPKPSISTDVKHGKARMHEDEPSIAQVQQYAQMRSRPSADSSEASRPGRNDYDGPRSSKRRRLSVERHENIWEGAEDVKMLNKAYRAAEDALDMKDAELASLRQELVHARTSYERKESELRQDLLFRHIIAREQATRDHEKEKISLHRLITFLKGDHEKNIEKLEEDHRTALTKEQARTQDALAQAVKQKQLAQQRETTAFMQIQHMNTVMEHANALSKTYEGDLTELQRINIEELEERERDHLGLPPAYDSLQDIKGYRTPYEAARHRDAGDLDLDTIEATITKTFMRQLQAANCASLALREHADRAKAAGSGSLLYHKAMLAFANACMDLRKLYDHAIERKTDTDKSQSTAESSPSSVRRLPSLLSVTPPTAGSKAIAKLPSLSDLGLPAFKTKEAQTNDTPMCEHPVDLFMRFDRPSRNKSMSVAEVAHSKATIAVADRISYIMYDLCTHIFAALDVREHGSERLCHSRCARLGTWLRLADDALLQCLKRRLEATVVEELRPQCFDSTVSCSKCASEHCGGYCLRLQMLSYNINKLKAVRRGFDKISSPTRAGMYFTDTWHWLKDTLENERQISANILLPPTRQPTPEMTEEEMALAIQHSALDPATAAAREAIRQQSSEAELAQRLQAIRNEHFPRPRFAILSQITRPQPTPTPTPPSTDAATVAISLDTTMSNILEGDSATSNHDTARGNAIPADLDIASIRDMGQSD